MTMTMTTGFAAILTAAAVSLAAAPAFAGWENTDWGMSPDAVAAAVPGTRPPVERNGMTRISARHSFQGVEAAALFAFEDGGLVSVSLLFAGVERCEAAEKAVLERHGDPARVETGGDDLVSWTWRDADRGNSVAFQKRPEADGQVKFCFVGYAPADAAIRAPGF